ncbi:potassium channel family protein [Prauserella alba]|uniref:Potassium channel family protein n=1 Tax=Prauserella alba TaxID=176898 RepID=A0ABP4FU43_9PSEU|nr:potassium channel family protein [Prauserella alba]MCP2181730.1 Ion channel [Prauserella alba]
MGRRRFEELSTGERRRIVAGVLLRTLLSAGLVITVYYLLPLDRPFETGPWLRFGIALVGFGVAVTWQLRVIAVSDTPRLKATQLIAVGVPLLVVLFASAYAGLDRAQPGSFSEDLGRTDALYFTLTVFATVGFGDIVPETEGARILTMIQMAVGLVVVGVAARAVVGAVRAAQRRADEESQASQAGRADRTR